MESSGRGRTRSFIRSRGFLLLVALALAVRLVFVAITPGWEPARDAIDYDRHARVIASTGQYPESRYAPGNGPSAFRPPGYPYALAAVYAVSGKRWDAARLVQAAIGAVGAALVGVLAFQLWGRRIGFAALALAALYPPLALSSATLFSEAIFVPLVVAAVAAALHCRAAPRPLHWAALAGVLVGLATLVRPLALVMIVPLTIGLWGSPPRSWRALRAPAVMALAAVLAVAPWMVRNAVVMDDLTLSTNSDYVLAGTYNATSAGDPDFPAAWRPPNLVHELKPLLDTDLQESELSDRLRQEALDYIGEHPLYPLRVIALNTLRTLDLYGGLERSRAVYAAQGFGADLANLAIFSFYGLALLAIASLVTRQARRAPVWIWLVPVLLVLVAVAGQGLSRYRLPAEPFIILLAAPLVVAAAERLRARWKREEGAASR